MIDGYKDSPLGEIPKNWTVVKSNTVFELIHGYQFRDYDFTETGLPIAKIGQINKKGEIDMTGCSFFSSDRANEFVDKRIFNGDVLMALTGATLGKSCWVAGLENPVYQNYRVGKFVPHDENILSKQFLYFLVGSPLALDQIMSKINSGAQGNVGKSDFEKLKIPLPPIKEQQKIAKILSTVDDKIEVIDQQIIETQALKKGLMQRLLSKGIGHTEFKDSPLGMIPKSWEIVKLSDVCHKIGDGIHSTPKYVDNSDYYFVNGNNLINGTLTVSDKTKCVSKDEYEKLRIKLNVNSILMSINGTIGNLAMYQNEHVVFGKSASYISANEDRLHYLFLYYFLQHSNTKKYFYDELTGSTIQNLSLKTIRNTPTILPSKTEQEKISYILGSVDEKLEVLSEKKNHYQELKQGLMQQLLTGKIRVKV
jgi:type I restriction enzyme S subunit